MVEIATGVAGERWGAAGLRTPVQPLRRYHTREQGNWWRLMSVTDDAAWGPLSSLAHLSLGLPNSEQAFIQAGGW